MEMTTTFCRHHVRALRRGSATIGIVDALADRVDELEERLTEIEAERDALLDRAYLYPSWLLTWRRKDYCGVSSNTIAAFMVGGKDLLDFVVRRPDAPYDTSDVGRCVELLDLARKHGDSWDRRLFELSQACKAWEPLVPYWHRITAAFHRDVVAQSTAKQAENDRRLKCKDGSYRRRPLAADKDFRLPPSETWWLVSNLRSGRNPPGTPETLPWRPLDDLSPEPLESM